MNQIKKAIKLLNNKNNIELIEEKLGKTDKIDYICSINTLKNIYNSLKRNKNETIILKED